MTGDREHSRVDYLRFINVTCQTVSREIVDMYDITEELKKDLNFHEKHDEHVKIVFSFSITLNP